MRVGATGHVPGRDHPAGQPGDGRRVQATWLATGHDEFGQAGRVGSSHLPWLGLGFFVVIPAIGGLLYGPASALCIGSG
jgi:hypothetical protein